MTGTPTLDTAEVQTVAAARRGRVVRRGVAALLAVFVLIGASGWLGYRQTSVVQAGEDFDVELSYPQVTRGGLPSSWTLTVVRRDGAPLGDVAVSTSQQYFDLFDRNGLDPEPDAVSQTDRDLTWVYRTVDTPSLTVSLDVRTQPDARWRYAASTAITVDGVTIAEFDYRTTVVP